MSSLRSMFLATVSAVVIALAHSAPAGAVPAEFAALLEIKIGHFPTIPILRGVEADISLAPGGGVEMRFPASAFAGYVSLPVTDLASFPVGGLRASISNGEGTLVETPEGGLSGRLPLGGLLSVCLFGACNAAVANIDVPFTLAGTRGVGLGGSAITTGFLVQVTLTGAPWSTDESSLPHPLGPVVAPSGFAHGPVSGGASSAAAPGGRMRLTTPIVVQTNIGASPVLRSYASFDLFGGAAMDSDGDGILDLRDNCVAVPNVEQRDFDGSGIGDDCNEAVDPDGDEIENWRDNCDLVPNVAQTDFDQSGIGDACNDASDFDGDEITDDRDNCYALPNPGQEDLDADLLGDPCDPFPNEVNDATRALRMELAQTSFVLAQRTAQRDAAVASVALLTTEVAEKEEIAVDLAAENVALRSTLDAAAAEKLALEETVAALSRKLGSPPCRADLNDDAIVNFADLAAFKATFLRTCEP